MRTTNDWEREREMQSWERAVETPEGVEPVRYLDSGDNVQLAERSGDGLKVELVLNRTLDVVGIVLHQGLDPVQSAFIPPEKALDAFHHPYIYLPA